MADKQTFIKEHVSDGNRLINIQHITQIKLSRDGHHASVLTINDSEWIRVSVFFDDLKKMINIV